MKNYFRWFLISCTITLSMLSMVNSGNAYSVITVKVLIHNGAHAGSNCVNGTVACLSTSNVTNLIPGVWFKWGFSGAINKSTLAGYEVLVMPGGDGFGKGYYRDSSINAADIRKWVASGKGYFGTCAGAYGGVSTVYDYAPATTKVMYYAWGLAPHVNAQAVAYNRMVKVTMTSAGKTILDYNGILPLHNASGAAMKNRTSGAKILATYADNSNGFKGYAAIVADTYGKGRTILCGPHPELNPRQPKMVARMTAWAAKALSTTSQALNVKKTSNSANRPVVKTKKKANPGKPVEFNKKL